MLNIKKRYLTNENNKPVAVQIDIETFEKMERIIEDYALTQLMEENDPEDNLSLEEAKAYYDKLRK
jgi:acetyl-CoA carboxylase beta subunit